MPIMAQINQKPHHNRPLNSLPHLYRCCCGQQWRIHINWVNQCGNPTNSLHITFLLWNKGTGMAWSNAASIAFVVKGLRVQVSIVLWNITLYHYWLNSEMLVMRVKISTFSVAIYIIDHSNSILPSHVHTHTYTNTPSLPQNYHFIDFKDNAIYDISNLIQLLSKCIFNNQL